MAVIEIGADLYRDTDTYTTADVNL